MNSQILDSRIENRSGLPDDDGRADDAGGGVYGSNYEGNRIVVGGEAQRLQFGDLSAGAASRIVSLE